MATTVAVYVEAFDGARVAAVAAERIGALDDFSDCLGASQGSVLGGKAA
jgi:hypothetical protein